MDNSMGQGSGHEPARWRDVSQAGERHDLNPQREMARQRLRAAS